MAQIAQKNQELMKSQARLLYFGESEDHGFYNPSGALVNNITLEKSRCE
jgi:hypothetical protein